ncbi:MAG: glycoside hydrolase family 9 protein [Deltaproteobacteria bacterium]|nr:glycoside hydrolase family 9 protein [Deltaproteobacteria bacterium]
MKQTRLGLFLAAILWISGCLGCSDDNNHSGNGTDDTKTDAQTDTASDSMSDTASSTAIASSDSVSSTDTLTASDSESGAIVDTASDSEWDTIDVLDTTVTVEIDTGTGLDVQQTCALRSDIYAEEVLDAATGSQGSVSDTIILNHFGWRPTDEKIAAIRGLSAVSVELRRAADDSLVSTYTSSAAIDDEDSVQSYSTVDFSEITTQGNYYLYLPNTSERSYAFRIHPDVYGIVGAVAMKSFYYQRCNHSKELPYASDAILGAAGIGGNWVDTVCHDDDFAVTPGPDSANNGTLDLHGGWHDAGDYQKTLWGRGLPVMLFAYEINPAAWSDAQLNIPESGNCVPDILDELSWELDFYVRMQRPDGHFMSSTKGHDGSVVSPPGQSDEARAYFDGTSPSGDGWSGGGVTIAAATGNAVVSLAHAAIVFALAGADARAQIYAKSALKGWQWLAGASLSNEEEILQRKVAAAAVYRLSPETNSAAQVVSSISWDDWEGGLPWNVTPSDGTLSVAAWHMLLNSHVDSTTIDAIRAAAGEAIVDRGMQQAGIFGGMYGDASNPWEWGWGSNRQNAQYGANFLMAHHFGIRGSYTLDEVAMQGRKYAHYMMGMNAMNMVYLTNMAAYGGEHSSFQIYHAWFSYTAGGNTDGNDSYNGIPATVTDPLYPYYPDDDQVSTYGPAPGLVPGGPNMYYGGAYDIPGLDAPATSYRDWSIGCDWSAQDNACLSASWEITEPMNAYQGPFILLISFLM